MSTFNVILVHANGAFTKKIETQDSEEVAFLTGVECQKWTDAGFDIEFIGILQLT